jgi:hypothetical protein
VPTPRREIADGSYLMALAPGISAEYPAGRVRRAGIGVDRQAELT